MQQTTQEHDNASQQTVTLTTSILSNTEIQSGTAVGLQVSPGKSQAVSTDQAIDSNTNQERRREVEQRARDGAKNGSGNLRLKRFGVAE